MDILQNIITTLVGLIVGGYITYKVSKTYYEKASIELRDQSERLVNATNIILRALEEGNIAEYTRDESGNIKGLVIHLKQSINASTSSTASATKK